MDMLELVMLISPIYVVVSSTRHTCRVGVLWPSIRSPSAPVGEADFRSQQKDASGTLEREEMTPLTSPLIVSD